MRLLMMGIGKTEINLQRLISAAPIQQNQSKLIHYVATLREQLEQLSEEKTPQGLPRVTKAKVNEYYEKIEAVASTIAAQVPDSEVPDEPFAKVPSYDAVDSDPSKPIKLDTAAQVHIDKRRKLQEDLTDEMVVLARQLKESSLMISQSVQNTEKILDSTMEAIEQSLASTGTATVRATKIYSETSKTSCFQWLLIFVVTCVFIMVVLLIRVA